MRRTIHPVVFSGLIAAATVLAACGSSDNESSALNAPA
jgi:hypothetical protein